MTKKIIVQIHKHRFELESSGNDQDAVIQAAVRDLNNRVESLRREHGFPDSTRAIALLALLVSLEKQQGKKTALTASFDEKYAKMLDTLREEVEETLSRTDQSPAKVSTQ